MTNTNQTNSDRLKIVIAGGGSAGWMTAAYLSKALGHNADITLVESPNIGAVGVGEATFSYIHLFFDFLGLREEDWMAQCNASYKVAIRFVDWNHERRAFYHPFQTLDLVKGRSIAEWWLKLRRDTPLDYSCFVIPPFCDARKSPVDFDGRVFDSKVDGRLFTDRHEDGPALIDDLQIQYPYAYHFDANLLAKFLSRYAQRRGVVRVLDEVTGVQQNPDGSIQSLQTKTQGRLEGDLFIDCTGFRGLLINQVLGEPFLSFTDSLPCDRAVAMQVPSDPEREGINPYTTATALSAGWVWNIPLFHRTGTGYVYASAFVSPEEAEREFRRYLGKRAEGCNALHIKMRVGRNRDSWVKNCVAIGLSSGFVEPLESTGIFFIQHGIEQLINHLPQGRSFQEESIRSYNRAVADCIDGVREFLTLHYVAGTRQDTAFWKATKNDLDVPEELQERLRLWKKELPTERTINQKEHGFTAYSYVVMLAGLGHQPEQSAGILDYMTDTAALAAFERIHQRAGHLARNLPPLYDYLCAKYEKKMALATA